MELIEFKNVSYAYNYGYSGEVTAVENVSLTVRQGEFVALVGHNGSGKSTMAKLMNGLLIPNEGQVLVGGLDTADRKKLFDIRKDVGVVFQNPDNQMIATIIEDDVAFGPENLGLKPDEIRKRVDFALEAVGMSQHKRGTPFRLSGGQKQRIAIAGVLAIMPKVIVLDESTAMLDPVGREEVMAVVKNLREKENMTVIMITHFMEEAADADRIVVMSGGKIIMDGGKEIFQRADELYGAGLDLPLAMDIADRLKKSGFRLEGDITDEKELADAVCRLKFRT